MTGDSAPGRRRAGGDSGPAGQRDGDAGPGRLPAGAGTGAVHPSSGLLEHLTLASPPGGHPGDSAPEAGFIGAAGTGGMVRLAVPLPGHPAHWVETGTHGTAAVERRPGGVRLIWTELASARATLPIRVELDVTGGSDGLVLRARVHNGSEHPVPQVAFPQLLGLEPVAGPARTRLQLPGRRMLPFEELRMRPDDVTFLELPQQEYLWYGSLDLTMKWFDLGDARQGLTVYSRDTRYTTQGLLVERRDRHEDLLDVRWVHYPCIAPGETWDSGEFVVLPHPGDWYTGADAYRRFASAAYPYRAPERIRQALAVRSLWPAVRNGGLNFRFNDLPRYVAEVADPELGIAEVVFWHWWEKNGYPILVDERLGSEADLRRALAACRAMGVPVSLFVSHHILRDTDETDETWVHRNPAGQKVVWNWTYGPDFLPRFRTLFAATHSMVKGSALSPGWREAGLAEYRRIMERGAASICFDVCYAWEDPDFSPDADGRPDEAGEKLLGFARAARDIIHAHDPDGAFSGEWPSDTKVPVLDYTWDWRNGYDVAAAAPFRYVFPQFRLNANVGAHPRGAVLSFMEGALLNVMPGNLRTERLADHPQLVALLKRLNRLRRRFMAFFTEGRYHHLEAVTATGCEARLYSHAGDLLLIAANPTGTAVTATVGVDPAVLGLRPDGWSVSTHTLDGATRDHPDTAPGRGISLDLGADDLVIVAYRADAGPGGAEPEPR